jgi:hypothetical protein
LPAVKVLLRWALLSGLLHFIWELAQLPLYTIFREGSSAQIAFAIAHCTGGDVLIALGTYVVAAGAMGSWRWPAARAAAGWTVLVAAGIVYTAFSEWLNVSVRGSWGYSPAMPTISGIGLSPLAQWVVVPAVALALLRRRLPGR